MFIISNIKVKEWLRFDVDKRVPNAYQFHQKSVLVMNSSKNDQPNNKMHEHITYFVLFLLLLIIVYGLIMQSYWLIGTVCFPVIAYGVYKIFDRYL